MKIPQAPPNFHEVFRDVLKNVGRFLVAQLAGSRATTSGKYHHWDKLRHLKPPDDLSHTEWWVGLKAARQTDRKRIPLRDVEGTEFSYIQPDPVPERLHQIDQGAAGSIGMLDPITNPETKDRYLVRSLVEEAITSSQLEGAATTRPIAKEMIRTKRTPRDNHEWMILNNFRAMQRIGELRRRPLTKEMVFEIHRIITSKTLNNPSAAGRFRRGDEPIVVDDLYGQVFHHPPPAEQLEERLDLMCAFANGKNKGEFIHPVIRSIILHFWAAYDHPFVDGNGRTARALFYWSMLHQGFWLCEYISISEIIRKGPAKYGRAFLYTETDDNDLTYFILYHLDVISRAIDELHKYIDRKTKQLKATESELRGVIILNHRQRALISHALRHPHQRYTVESHRSSHGVVPQTARTDLLDLMNRELLVGGKVGREWQFTPAPELERKLAELP